jgi:hypothetical protein
MRIRCRLEDDLKLKVGRPRKKSPVSTDNGEYVFG